MKRRAFLQSALALGFAAELRAEALEPWTPGTLDIHHLAYGRGNSTFILAPDGTTMLIDAGATEDSLDVSAAQKPDASMRPGQWIAKYVLRHMRAAGRRELDYGVVTHIHPDHIDGLMDVDASVPIGKLIDRDYPDYSYIPLLQAPFAENYRKFVKARACERVKVGRADQIKLLRSPEKYARFTVRNLAANGEVWTGAGNETRHCFPDLKTLRKEDYPNENMCSIALRIGYGNFDYFTGGDLTSDAEEGDAWRDIETPVARAAGPVEVAVANHHAYFDAVSAESVRALQPQVFIIPAWYVAHPNLLQLRRMFSKRLHPGDRDVFATNLMAANRAVNNQFTRLMKSTEGHIIVRVSEGGAEFRVIVVDNSDDSDRVKAVFGPYRCS